MPTMNHVVECVADQYAIPEYVMDIIYMYINRNMIKSCTDEFTNPIFIKHIKRMIKGEYERGATAYTDEIRFKSKINQGRLMLRLLYPKSITTSYIPAIEGHYTTRNNRFSRIEAEPTFNGLNFTSCRDRQGNFKMMIDINNLYINERELTIFRSLNHHKRSEMLEFIDYHHQALKAHGVIDKIPKLHRNKKNEFYISYMMPKVSNFKR